MNKLKYSLLIRMANNLFFKYRIKRKMPFFPMLEHFSILVGKLQCNICLSMFQCWLKIYSASQSTFMECKKKFCFFFTRVPLGDHIILVSVLR